MTIVATQAITIATDALYSFVVELADLRDPNNPSFPFWDILPLSVSVGLIGMYRITTVGAFSGDPRDVVRCPYHTRSKHTNYYFNKTRRHK
jgi:hypothetical protein